MKRSIKVLIVDDHPAMAMGTKFILEAMDQVRVVGIAPTENGCLQMIREHEPDLIILDFQLRQSNALEVLTHIRSMNVRPHVVIFTGIDYLPYYNDLLEFGVSGIMSKDSSDDQIRLMVACIADGNTFMPIHIYHQLRYNDTKSHTSPLSDEEMNIMSMIVRGFTNEQIAGEIHMSKRSVDNYLKKIYEKLGVKSRAQAIERFVEIK